MQASALEFQNAALPTEDRLEVVELAPNTRAVRQALANLQPRPALNVAVRLSETNRCLRASGHESARQHWPARGW